MSTSYYRIRGLVTLEIADNGRGLAPEIGSRIFEPYFSTKEKGTGLGLTIVSQIIEDTTANTGVCQRAAGHPLVHRITGAREMRALPTRQEGGTVINRVRRRVERAGKPQDYFGRRRRNGVRESVREVLTDEGYRVLDTGDWRKSRI